MRQKISISPAVIDEFKKWCALQNLSVDYIDEYLYIISGLIAFDELRDFPARLTRIAGRKTLETQADRQLFVRRYMDFVSSVELFIESLGKGQDKALYNRLIDDLFDSFREIYANDPVHFSLVICEWGYKIVKIVTDTYRIEPGDSLDDFTRNTAIIMGDAYGQILSGLVSMIGQNLKEPQEDRLRLIFRIMTVMVSDMNSRRNIAIETRLNQKSTGEVGRNDPCPCGSGLKYKKCCMGKDRSVTEDGAFNE